MNISVAMCTYNGAPYLDEQLKSIAAQTCLPDELIVCDDCSTDETRNLLEQFAASEPFPVHLHFNETNLGSNKNFEQAIGLCKGDVIALCDQDDIWHPEKLALMKDAFGEQPEIGLVFTNGKVIDANSQLRPYSLWEGARFDSVLQRKVRGGRAFDVLTQQPFVTGTAMAFRARFRELVLPIPEDLGFFHDEWITLLIAAGARLAMIDKPLIEYRHHARQQIGITQPSAKAAPSAATRVREAMQRGRPFLTQIRKLRVVAERLALHRDFFACEKACRMIRDQTVHLEARASIPEQGLKSLPCLLRELVTLRYHRYSRGLSSAVKDLWLLKSNRAQST